MVTKEQLYDWFWQGLDLTPRQNAVEFFNSDNGAGAIAGWQSMVDNVNNISPEPTVARQTEATGDPLTDLKAQLSQEGDLFKPMALKAQLLEAEIENTRKLQECLNKPSNSNLD